MANITIVDTGYLNTNNSGTQLSTSLRANSGDEIDLKSVQVTFTRQSNLDDTPKVASYDDTDVNFVGFNNAGITIRGKVDMSDSSERELIRSLNELVKTKGWKAVYYDASTGTNENTEGQIIYQLSQVDGALFTSGERTAFGVDGGATVRHLCMHFKSINIVQKAESTNLTDFTLIGIVTKKNTPNSL